MRRPRPGAYTASSADSGPGLRAQSKRRASRTWQAPWHRRAGCYVRRRSSWWLSFWLVPDAVQRDSGAPQSRDLHKLGSRNGPGSAMHHFVLHRARDKKLAQSLGDDAREQGLIGLAVGHRDAGVARSLDAAVERDAFVIVPKVLLRGEDLERLVLGLPDIIDLEDEIWLVVALLGLVRLEQIDRRRRILVLGARLVAHRLCDDARFLREVRGVRMIEIVRVLQRVREHESRIGLPVDVDHAVEVRFGELERIVAAVEELDLGAQKRRGPLRLVLAARLHLLHRRACF